jgi:hypothetical protein
MFYQRHKDFRFCRNKELKTRCQVGVLRGLDSQAVELVSSGGNLAFGAIKLPLFDHVHGFDPCNEFGCAMELFEPHHGSCSTFNGPMILLYEIVEIFGLS